MFITVISINLLLVLLAKKTLQVTHPREHQKYQVMNQLVISGMQSILQGVMHMGRM